MLRVWQKVVPLVIFINFVDGGIVGVLVVVGCAGSLVGGLGGFLQTQLRILLGYSSINHRGWLIVGRIYRVVRVLCYFVIYSIIVGFMFYVLSYVELGRYENLSKGFGVIDVKFLGFLVVLLITLAGLPPTLGFAIKWSVFLGVVARCPVALVFLLVGSLLRLYYYLCVGLR